MGWHVFSAAHEQDNIHSMRAITKAGHGMRCVHMWPLLRAPLLGCSRVSIDSLSGNLVANHMGSLAIHHCVFKFCDGLFVCECVCVSAGHTVI